MADDEALSSCHLTKTMKKPQVVWTNFVGDLEKNNKSIATKQMLNQDKAIFKTIGQFCGSFYLPLPHLPVSAVAVLVLSSGNVVLKFPSPNPREQIRSYLQIIMYVLFWPERPTHLSVLPTLNTGRKSGGHCSKINNQRSTNQQMPSARDFRERYKLDHTKPAEEAGLILFGKWGHSKVATYKEDCRKPHAHPGKMHAQNSP